MKTSAKKTFSAWILRNSGLMAIYSIGFIVILLQLRSIL